MGNPPFLNDAVLLRPGSEHGNGANLGTGRRSLSQSMGIRERRARDEMGMEGARVLINMANQMTPALRLCGDVTDRTHLDLSHESLGPVEALLLAHDLLLQGDVQELNLHGNELCGDGENSYEGSQCWVGLEALAAALQSNTRLTILDLSKNSLGGVAAAAGVEEAFGCTVLAKLLTSNQSLTMLDLSSCGIGPKGVSMLTFGLHGNHTLRTLLLDSNELVGREWDDEDENVEGLQDLGEALMENATLTTLSLRACDIGTVGAISLATGVAMNSSLQVLNVLRNDLGEDGTTALLEAARESGGHCSLTGIPAGAVEVDLSQQWLGPEDVKLLAHELAQNDTVTKIDLSGNALCGVKYGRGTYDISGIHSLAEALHTNVALQEIDITGSMIRSADVCLFPRNIMLKF
ncbi:hypothetical protein CYMTET_29353 [Cymbomonas tetramitiformis]|uniref:Uncharacterized protein n=1 Tax=Cymbomonas tetramitiformis TaxID=36881 RepID=A0AAE0KVA2_9CHLO|nr:hypothetical protein CYMTET_29353 [Cymbomonas tetramitiformis]